MAMLALFLRSKKSQKCSPILIPLRRIFCFSFCTSHEIQNFCASDAVVATLVAMPVRNLIFALCSRYNSRYGFLFRRICSSRPGNGEQRGQSLAALTARGRGLDCFQPQPRQPVLRQNKLRIFRFRASTKAQSLRLFLLSPRSRLLRGDPIYGRTLCVQAGWAA